MSLTVLNLGDILIVAQHINASAMSADLLCNQGFPQLARHVEMVMYSATDRVTGLTETVVCRAADFRRAQVVAVLGDEAPDSETGVQNELVSAFYPVAESVQPKAEALRWIP